MGKARKRHSAKVIQAPTEGDTLRQVEKIDLLASPGDSLDQKNVDDGLSLYESRALGNVPLSGRLGVSGRSSKDLSSISLFNREAYEAVGYGLSVGPLPSPSKDSGKSPLNLEGLSLSEFDIKCVEWCRSDASKKSLTMWAPHYVDSLISRACAENGPFPHYSIKFFLQHGRVTDRRRELLEKILSLDDLSLLCSYLQYVPDIQESSIVRCLEHIIHADCHTLGSLFQPLVDCGIKEQLLWRVFSLDVDLPCLRQALPSLSEPDRMFCVKSLQKILDCYLNTFASFLGSPNTAKGLGVRLPSKHAACKWLAALLDSLYPAIVFDFGAGGALQHLRYAVERDLKVSEDYEQVGNLLSSLMSNRKSRAPRLDRQSATCPTLYAVESVFF